MQLKGGLPQQFADQMGQLLGPDFPTDIGLAVSGGGDSMAMLHLAAGWARVYGVRLWVVTVDHGLRNESAQEAALVADECAGLDLPHVTLKWADWDGQGNLQDAARRARRDLIDGWRGGLQHVLFAHTADDQAETFLMRLIRGSGVDGLSGMAAVQSVASNKTSVAPVQATDAPPLFAGRTEHWQIVRPLLIVPRATLRHFLQTLKIPFVEDPSNDNTRFTRVRLRKLLQDEGLSIERLIKTQSAMSRARAALEQRAQDVQMAVLCPPFVEGIRTFDRDHLETIEVETQLRILSQALQHVTGASYRPRLSTLESAVETAFSGGKATLHGAIIVPKADKLFVGREYAAVRDTVSEAGSNELWDGRYLVYGNDIKGLQVKALGDAGAAEVKADRDPGLPHDLVKSLPGVWEGARLIGCRPLMWGRPYDMKRR